MEKSLDYSEISKNSDLLFNYKKDNDINTYYISNDNNPISLKYQHFENFTKKIINNENISKKNIISFGNELNIGNKTYNKNQNNNYMINFPLFKSVTNFSNSSTKNKYNYLTTYSYNSDKNINFINKKDTLKIISDIKKDNKNISFKNKILNKEKLNMEIGGNNKSNICKNDEEKLKLKAKTPNQIFLNKNNKNNKNIHKDISRNKTNLFLIKHNSLNSEGYLGRKELNGIPFTFEPIMVYNNIYSNKSEKKRHEIILDEFIKLRQYIERQPEKKLILIKEFLNKYYIEYEKYDESQLLSLCDFICFHDKNTISCVLKPYLKIKNMIIELINNINKINNSLGIKDIVNKKNDIKEEIISEEGTINDGDGKTLGNNLNIYLSPNIIENNQTNNNINTENFKIKFYEKENLRKKKYNHRYENNLTNYDEDAFKQIKIKLRDLEHQKKLHIPDKNYSFRNDLIIKDMNKEMNILKNNFEQTLYNKSFPIRKKYNSQNNFKNNNNINITSKIKNSIIFSQFKKKPKNYRKIEEEILNELNKINKSNSTRFMLMKKENIIKDYNKSNIINKYSMDEIIKRLYYKPMKIKFDINEVIKNNKITEYYALKLAKYNKFLLDINNNSYLNNDNNNNKDNLKNMI